MSKEFMKIECVFIRVDRGFDGFFRFKIFYILINAFEILCIHNNMKRVNLEFEIELIFIILLGNKI
jgi:hypothetical protein